MMRSRYLLIFLLGVFLINLTLAINCNPTQIISSYQQGNSPEISTSCTNSGNTSVTFSLVGDSSFSTSSSSISPGTQDITIKFSSSANVGVHSGSISFSDGSSVSIFSSVSEPPPSASICEIDVFPKALQNVKVQQGETKQRTVKITVPSCFSEKVNFNGVLLQSDEKPIQLGEYSLIDLNPGESLTINLDINAEEVSTGTYSDILSYNMFNSTSGLKLNVDDTDISVIVSSGIQPINNLSLSDLPTCSVDAVEMNTNQTYHITCSRTNPNIQIFPIVDSQFIKGINVEETSSQYIYSFQPKIIGTTKVGAEFKYKNALIGSPYEVDVRISPSGTNAVGSIHTKFVFYQEGNKVAKENLRPLDTIIQLVDNTTGNIIPVFDLYINGQIHNHTYIFEPQKSYELRASAPAYLDNLINFTTTENLMTFTISPDNPIYYVNDVLIFNSSENGTIFKIEGVDVGAEYTLTKSGNITVYAEKTGFKTENKTIEVKDRITIIGQPNIDFVDWKKGSKIVFDISESADWMVTDNGKQIANGTGSRVEFEIEDYGILDIRANGQTVTSRNIQKGSSWYTPWSSDNNWIKYGFWVLLGIGLIFGYMRLFGGSGETASFVSTG